MVGRVIISRWFVGLFEVGRSGSLAVAGTGRIILVLAVVVAAGGLLILQIIVPVEWGGSDNEEAETGGERLKATEMAAEG